MRAPISASADDPITLFLVFNTAWTALFVSFVYLKFFKHIKKWPPGLLRSFNFDGYDALMWVLSIIFLA